MGQSRGLIRADIKEMYSYYFHRINLEKEGRLPYEKGTDDEEEQWFILTLLLFEGENKNEFWKRFIKSRSKKDL